MAARRRARVAYLTFRRRPRYSCEVLDGTPAAAGRRARSVGPLPFQASAATLLGVPWRSQVIDYALARRSLLADVAHGRVSFADVCDAHPDLQRAARHYGEPTDSRCPLCRNDRLTRVTYAYGDELQHASGRARSTRSLEALATRYAYLRIYVVEVCRSCGWNHLVVSYVTGSQLQAVGNGSAPDEPMTAGLASRSEPVPDAVPVSRPRPRPEPRRRTARQ